MVCKYVRAEGDGYDILGILLQSPRETYCDSCMHGQLRIGYFPNTSPEHYLPHDLARSLYLLPLKAHVCHFNESVYMFVFVS